MRRCMHSGVATEARMEARGGLKHNRRCNTSTSLKKSVITNLLILVALSHLIHAVSAQSRDEPFRGTGAKIYPMTHNLNLDHQSSFIAAFISSATEESEFQLENILKVLRNQTGSTEQPFGWILPNLIARRGIVTLAFRTDNLYLIGFTDKDGNWYSFKGYKDLIPGSTELDISASYGKQGMGGFNKLGDLPLSRRHALDAVDILWDYQPSTTPKEVLQNATATLLLVIPESARLTAVFQSVMADWDSKEGIQLKDKIKMELLRNWGNLSSLAMIGASWDSNTVKDMLRHLADKGITIRGKEDAYQHLKVLLMANDVRKKELVIKRINDPQS